MAFEIGSVSERYKEVDVYKRQCASTAVKLSKKEEKTWPE